LSSQEIWVIAKIIQKRLQDCTIEVLSDARLIASQISGKLCVIVLSNLPDNLAQILRGRQVDTIYSVNHLLLENYTTDGYVLSLAQLIDQCDPYIILGSSASDTDDYMPRLAAHINSPLVTGCIQVSVDQNHTLQFIRPSHLNKIFNTITCSGKPPYMATIIPGVIGIEPSIGEHIPEVRYFSPNLLKDNIRISPIATIKGNPDTIDIREAKIIIAGGKGACKLSAWNLLEYLAKLLGASIGGTRMALDQNFIIKDRLIGQTGKCIHSDVYIAAGISGAYYHLLGVNADHLIAINLDRFAPIFSFCKLGIVGDLNQIIPAFCRLMEKYSRYK
jgi:electron transfer flavoprotein alpha subunit